MALQLGPGPPGPSRRTQEASQRLWQCGVIGRVIATAGRIKPAVGLVDGSFMDSSYSGPDRRNPLRVDSRTGSESERRSGMDRRRGPGRRRGEVRRAAEEGEITGELLEFIMAIDEYKRINERPFPTWSEVFEIVHYLGYRKVAPLARHINTASDGEALEDVHAHAGKP